MSFSKPSQPLDLAAFADGPPPSPLTMRSIRKIQSHQTLSSNNSPSTPAKPARQHPTRLSDGPKDFPKLQQPPTLRTGPHRRARSNSDASHEPVVSPTLKRPARKTGSGFGVKRSVLESLLRDGPQNGNIMEGLQEIRYLILSTRVDADADGMVCGLPVYSRHILTEPVYL